MNSKLKGWIFALVIVVILMIPIIVDYYRNKEIDVISYDKYLDVVGSSDFALVYLGNPDDSGYVDTKETLTTMKSDFDIVVNTLNTNDLTDIENIELSNANVSIDFSNGYVFIKDKSVVYVKEGSLTAAELKTLINKYYNNIIPEEEVEYKTAKDAASYKKAIDSKAIIMSVFGRDTCGWCNTYKPIYNELAAEYDFDVYYFDSDSYDSAEYSKILKSGLQIPASCTESGVAQTLDQGFGTPLTLFTKNGKVIDCISGYVNKDTLQAKLKKVGIIK